MDPKLWEILKGSTKNESEEVEAIIRFDRPQHGVKNLRIISKFGSVATCRLKKKSIIKTRQAENVLSLKAPSNLAPEINIIDSSNKPYYKNKIRYTNNTRRPFNSSIKGKGVVIGIIDWHCDFNHPDFKNADGSTRLIALWDQRESTISKANNYFGYGSIYTKDQINQALKHHNPYQALGYHPSTASHGTHVMGIASGNGSGGGPIGVAPEAELIFVHLANKGTQGLSNLGDSVRLLEAIDFIKKMAGQHPWVINLSVGLHGGPHDGCTLVEIAIDNLLQAAPNRFIVQSTGNYFNKNIHASGRLRKGKTSVLKFIINEADTSPNELEVWYSANDKLEVIVESPKGSISKIVKLGNFTNIIENKKIVGRIYNRAKDPNNLDNQINLFLYPNASSGIWRLHIKAEKISNGIFHAWLERDDCPDCQAQFISSAKNRFYTTGTIANGHIPIVVGAYNAHSKISKVAPFSSVGPTRDNRHKPDLVAPGVRELSSRSSSNPKKTGINLYSIKSGTSMAAPHVTGTVALCLQATSSPLTCFEIRNLILQNTDPVIRPLKYTLKYGKGYLNVLKAINGTLNLNKTINHF